jgi:hypothetical protein
VEKGSVTTGIGIRSEFVAVEYGSTNYPYPYTEILLDRGRILRTSSFQSKGIFLFTSILEGWPNCSIAYYKQAPKFQQQLTTVRSVV